MMTQEGTRTVNCLTQLPEMVSESTVEEGTHTEIIEIGTAPDSSEEEEDSDAALAARYGWIKTLMGPRRNVREDLKTRRTHTGHPLGGGWDSPKRT